MPVVFVMLDGLRPDAITPDYCPNLVVFRERSAHTMQARSVDPSVTLPCHVSIFHSVPPARHGILDNIWHSPARPIVGLVEQLAVHDKRSGMFHNWDVLRDLTRPEHLYFNLFIKTGYDLNGDEIVVDGFTTHYNQLQLDFAFVYFASIDLAGHVFGWMSVEYLRHVKKIDELVGHLLDHIPKDTAVLIQSDHGGHERTHGTTSDEDMLIPWMIAGPDIRAGMMITTEVSLLDTAPTIAHLLGVPISSQWEGKSILKTVSG